MDWDKVVKSLDDAWDAHRRIAEFSKNERDHDKHAHIATMAAMLRDALASGLPR